MIAEKDRSITVRVYGLGSRCYIEIDDSDGVALASQGLNTHASKSVLTYVQSQLEELGVI